MNAIKLNQNGKILQMVRHTHEAEDRNCFIDTPDSDVIFLTDTDADTVSVIAGVYSHDWDSVNSKLIANPDYATIGLDSLKQSKCREIDKNTENIILNSGYTFKGVLLSSSKTHQAELDSAHTNRNDPGMVYPYTVSSRDNKTQITIDNADDLHNQYLALFKDLIMTTKQLGNSEKAVVNAMTTIAEVKGYADPRPAP